MTLFQELGFDVGQGFHFAKPMSGEDLVRWLLIEKMTPRRVPNVISIPNISQLAKPDRGHKAFMWGCAQFVLDRPLSGIFLEV